MIEMKNFHNHKDAHIVPMIAPSFPYLSFLNRITN